MRKVLFGLVAVFGVCGVCLGQNTTTQQNQQPQAGQARTGQPGQVAQPGQNQINQAGQNQQGQNQQGQNLQGQAAQPGQPGQPVGPAGQFAQRPQSGQQAQQGQRSDQEIAACIHCECSNELAVAKLAEQKAHSDEVKQFAQQMVRDHSPGCQEMQQLAGQLLSQGQQNRGQQAGGGLDWVSIKKQIADQCLASVKEELQNKSSQEFDHCFMGQQIGAHMKVVDELKVLRNYASNDLRQKIDKELEMAQHHLQLAKKIEEKLEGDSSQRLSRRQNDGTK